MEVLETLYETSASALELEAADEDSKRGDRFIDFHDKVKESSHGDKRLYKCCHDPPERGAPKLNPPA